MSFGFSVGGFIAAIELANKIRKGFVDAPSQFKAISDEVRSLSIVLQDADVAFPKRELNDDQKKDLEDIDKGCRSVLDDLQRIIDKNTELSSESGSVGRRIKRVWKRLNWKPDDIDELRSRISTSIGFLNVFSGRLIRDNVVKLVRHQENQEWQAILDWLTPIDYATQQHEFITRRQKGTGQWLIDSTEFQTWLETDKQTLFCPGIPGAGKTILTSIVVDYLDTKFQKDSNTGIAYLYCNFRRQHEQKLEDLIASLLKQLVQELPSVPGGIKSLYDQHKDKRTRPLLDEILRPLHSVTATYSRVYVVVDALDECQVSERCRSRFLSSVFNLQAKTGANLFVTSRPILDIEKEFKGCLSLDILASDKDVGRYLDGHMSQLPTFVLSKPKLQAEIKTELIPEVISFLERKAHVEASSQALLVKKYYLSHSEYSQRFPRQMTGLHLASYFGIEAVVRLLLEKGANVEAKASNGRTPLFYAVMSGHEGVAKLLLAKNGVEPDSKDRINRTPLLYAAMNGNQAIIKLLLATDRVDVDSKDYYKSTPLSTAARMGHKDTVAFLLTKSQSLNVPDNFGRTPLWWARRTGYPEIIDLLLEKCKDNGISVEEDGSPIPTILVSSNNICKNCDVCLLSVSDKDIYYHCRFCNSGDFDICKECFVIKAHCLDQSHTLMKEINRESA